MAPVSPIALVGAAGTASVMLEAIKTLYGISRSINDFFNEHIEQMKEAENPTISRTGRVLELAKYGFGIGYITPVVIIAVGQLLLGNPLAAITAAATAATLTNPIAMTCAAIGAIYYGWSALTDQERNEILEKLSKGLEIGIELIKSMVRFVIDKTRELLTKKNIDEIKKYIGSAAALFGKSLGDVTHKITDVVGDTFDAIKNKTGEAIDQTADFASNTYDTVKEKTEIAVVGTRKAIEKLKAKTEKKRIE